MSSIRRAPPCCLALMSLLLSQRSRASGSLETTGAATAGNGLAARVFARGPEAAYYNPALLPEAAAGTTVGVFVLASHESVRLAPRPAGVDVPVDVYRAQLRNPDGTTRRLIDRPLATRDLPAPRGDTDETDTTEYVVLGVVRPLFRDALVIGFYGVLPLTTFQRQKAFFPDEREQYFQDRLHFELLGDRLVQSSFAVALGSRVADWLSIGAGVDITFGTVARTAVHVPDAADQREILVNPDVEVSSTFSPYFAIVGTPSRWLRVTTTLHLPVSSVTEGENQVRFWNYQYPPGDNAVRQTFNETLAYEPLRIGVGGVWTVREAAQGRAGIEVGAQAVLARWSTYIDRHGETPAVPFNTTVSPAVGAAVDLSGRRISADLGYAPSPVPRQDGRTNYVDGNRISADLAFETPLSVFRARLRATVRAFGNVYLERQETKSPSARYPVTDELPDGATDIETNQPIAGARGLQTNNPGYPGYTSSAWIVGGALAIGFPDL